MTLEEIKGRTIAEARSTLNSFVIAFNDGSGVLTSGKQNGSAPSLDIAVVAKDQLPAGEDAVCHVDWGWIIGSTVTAINLDRDRLRLTLDPVGPLTISVQMWQGAPFLAFQPFKSPRG